MILYTASVTFCILIHPRTVIQSKVPETLTSHETDHKKAYNEYLSRKPEDYVTKKSPNPDSNEAYGEFIYNQTANATALGLF